MDQFCIECVTRFVLQQRESDAFRALLRCTKMPHYAVWLFRYSLRTIVREVSLTKILSLLTGCEITSLRIGPHGLRTGLRFLVPWFLLAALPIQCVRADSNRTESEQRNWTPDSQ